MLTDGTALYEVVGSLARELRVSPMTDCLVSPSAANRHRLLDPSASPKREPYGILFIFFSPLGHIVERSFEGRICEMTSGKRFDDDTPICSPQKECRSYLATFNYSKHLWGVGIVQGKLDPWPSFTWVAIPI